MTCAWFTLVILATAACGRIGFTAGGASDSGDSRDDSGDGGDGGDDGPVSPHTQAPSTVDTSGIADTGSEADGTHLVFVDNAPGQNGNLVVFREGDVTTTITAYVSADAGTSWTRHVLDVSGFGINIVGGCQDSVMHAFHLAWLDGAFSDKYTRITPVYSGGDITGFDVETPFGLFDEGGDSPGPRDLAEIVDASGGHRLVLAATAPASGYKVAITTPGAGLSPTSQNDWAWATDHTRTGQTEMLLASAALSGDTPSTFLMSVSSPPAGAAGPTVIVGGLPANRRLVAWTLAPAPNGDFTLSAALTISDAFGGGTNSRYDASLSVSGIPSGGVAIVYGEDASAAAPGLHVATVDRNGILARDGFPPPSSNQAARHAVLAFDSASHPAVVFSQGPGELVATTFRASAWAQPVVIADLPVPVGAWSVTNPWRVDAHDRVGVYLDAGAAHPTWFGQVAWY